MKNFVVKGIVLIGLSSCIGFIQTKSSRATATTTQSTIKAASLDEQKYREALAIRKMLPSLGFNNINANANFISFLLYFGDDELRNKNGYSLSPAFFDPIIENDPYYTDFYVFLTNSVSLNAAQPERSAALMEKGLASLENNRLDDSFFVWRYKAVDELLFLDDAKSAEHSFRKAAEWAADSNHPEGEMLAYISQQTADFIAQNPDSKAAQIGAWGSVLSTAIDDGTRNRAIEAIEALGGELVTGEDGRVTIKYAQSEQETEN